MKMSILLTLYTPKHTESTTSASGAVRWRPMAVQSTASLQVSRLCIGAAQVMEQVRGKLSQKVSSVPVQSQIFILCVAVQIALCGPCILGQLFPFPGRQSHLSLHLHPAI